LPETGTARSQPSHASRTPRPCAMRSA
jgi:hypothetical protein